MMNENNPISAIKSFARRADRVGNTRNNRLSSRSERNMYYHGFDKKFPSGSKYWTLYDDQLIGMLFSKIVNKTMSVETPDADSEEIVDEMVQNLFDLCFYINKDFHDC
jgi:hypothetical protein